MGSNLFAWGGVWVRMVSGPGGEPAIILSAPPNSSSGRFYYREVRELRDRLSWWIDQHAPDTDAVDVPPAPLVGCAFCIERDVQCPVCGVIVRPACQPEGEES